MGLSRRNGNNIRSLHKIIEQIVDCDMFINNAQSQYSQTELLFAVYERWQHNVEKLIWCISTDLTRFPGIADIPNQSVLQTLSYKNQKIALDDAVRHLQHQKGPNLLLIRPGAVATQPGQMPGQFPYADSDEWAEKLVDVISGAYQDGFDLKEFSLDVLKNKIFL